MMAETEFSTLKISKKDLEKINRITKECGFEENHQLIHWWVVDFLETEKKLKEKGDKLWQEEQQ